MAGETSVLVHNECSEQALRAQLARDMRSSVIKMGLRGIKDPQPLKFAETINARVITQDRGRQKDGGFGGRSILVDQRISTPEGVRRMVRRR
jgi:hypothetical protein